MTNLSIEDLMEQLQWGTIPKYRLSLVETKRRLDQGEKDKETLSKIKSAMIKYVDYNDLGIMVTAIMEERK